MVASGIRSRTEGRGAHFSYRQPHHLEPRGSACSSRLIWHELPLICIACSDIELWLACLRARYSHLSLHIDDPSKPSLHPARARRTGAQQHLIACFLPVPRVLSSVVLLNLKTISACSFSGSSQIWLKMNFCDLHSLYCNAQCKKHLLVS